jgi:eukaryotic-like serine/threonine-protein kinase
MASLAQAIHSFQNGRLSHNEFFAQVDSVLATDRANSARLRDLLSEEHTRISLPADVVAELQRRIEHLVESKASLYGEETRLQTQSDIPSMPSSSLPPSQAPVSGPYSQGPGSQRMKGVGDTLNGRFVLEECIGFGGMGTVYKALDLRKLEASDRKPYIAIKVLNVQFSGHPQSLIALQREARKAQTLAHPNIVTVYDFDREGPMVYLTMEYLSGEPLGRLLRDPDFKGMSTARALQIVTGIGNALAYAHERGFVHCDLKPANVFVTYRGEVKVIDFGIARVFRKSEEDTEATVFDAGSLGGLTPAYASPEMIEHLVPDPRDDIYALACITYELLTARHPFNRLSATQARSAGMKPQRPDSLTHTQWRTLRAALSFDRETRTPTVTRFLDGMSRRKVQASHLTIAGTGLAIGVLLVVALGYYRGLQEGGEPAAPGAPAAPVAEAPQAVPKAAPAPVPPLTMAAVAPVLAGVPCSALAGSVQEHALQVHGYLSAGVGVNRLREMLLAVPGVQTLNVDVQQVSEDKCGVIGMLAPYWARNRLAGAGASIHTRQANAALTEGDPLIVDIKTPGYDSYVHVDYYSLDGAVAHLVPNVKTRANQAPPNHAAAIGSLGNWVIAKPFGAELVVLLITPVPLFDKVRPEVEPAADYLRAVEKQLAQLPRMAPKNGADRIAVDFVQITTKARKP